MPLPDGVRVVDYGIRGMHLAYDLLDGYAGLVVIDALPATGTPGELAVLEVGPDDLGEGELDAHGMAPVAVLASLGQLGGSLPPTYIVGCQPADVGEGMGLTPPSRPPSSRDRPGLRGALRTPRRSPLLAREGDAMRALGILTSIVGLAVIGIGVVIGKQAVPDVQRYMQDAVHVGRGREPACTR